MSNNKYNLSSLRGDMKKYDSILEKVVESYKSKKIEYDNKTGNFQEGEGEKRMLELDMLRDTLNKSLEKVKYYKQVYGSHTNEYIRNCLIKKSYKFNKFIVDKSVSTLTENEQQMSKKTQVLCKDCRVYKKSVSIPMLNSFITDNDKNYNTVYIDRDGMILKGADSWAAHLECEGEDAVIDCQVVEREEGSSEKSGDDEQSSSVLDDSKVHQ